MSIGKYKWDIEVQHEHITLDGFLKINAFKGDQRVGWIMASPDGEEMTLNRIRVEPTQQNAGVGTALLARLRQEARARQCVSIIGEIILNPNRCDGAASWFEKRGFSIDKRHRPWKMKCLLLQDE